jgi:hypothetical protein
VVAAMDNAVNATPDKNFLENMKHPRAIPGR